MITERLKQVRWALWPSQLITLKEFLNSSSLSWGHGAECRRSKRLEFAGESTGEEKAVEREDPRYLQRICPEYSFSRVMISAFMQGKNHQDLVGILSGSHK